MNSSLNRVGWVLAALILPTATGASFAIGIGGCAPSDSGGASSARIRGTLGEEDGGGGGGGGATDNDNDACTPPGLDGGGGGGEDGGGPSAPACDLSKPFNAPTLVSGFDSRDVYSARILANETSAYLSVASGTASGVDLYYATRTTTADPFVIGSPISELNNGDEDEYWPSPTADEKMIFFESAMPITPGGDRIPRIWTATRSSTSNPFGAPFVLGAFLVNTSEGAAYVHPNGKEIYFASVARGGAGDFDLFAADITDFGVVTGVRNITSANTSSEEMMPVASYDDRALFFTRIQAPGNPLRNIWVVGRSKTKDPFGIPQQVVEANSTYDEYPSAVSPDGCRLYLISNRPVSGVQRYRVWVAQKP